MKKQYVTKNQNNIIIYVRLLSVIMIWSPQDSCLRGIPESATSTNCYCIASINTPEDHGRMVKALLLQLVWDDSEPLFPLNGPVSTLPPNPASGPITPDNFKMARSVECPDLTDIGMTVDGTVVFNGAKSMFWLIITPWKRGFY